MNLNFSSFKYFMCGFFYCVVPFLATAEIDFQRHAIPGEDAFWAYNKKKGKTLENQKILIVPSMHNFNLRHINKDLADTLKKGDVLIEESKGFASWDDKVLFNNVLAILPSPKDLRDLGLIQPEGIKDSKGTLWTQVLPAQSQEYLQKNLGSFLRREKISLDALHPIVVKKILDFIYIMIMQRLGMDHQLSRYYTLNHKIIKGLESAEERKKLNVFPTFKEVDLKKGPYWLVDNTVDFIFDKMDSIQELEQISSNATNKKVNEHLQKIKENPTADVENRAAVFERNEMWVPRLMEYFERYKDKFIVVVVGSAHLPGSKGILYLLHKEGFDFVPFNQPS